MLPFTAPLPSYKTLCSYTYLHSRALCPSFCVRRVMTTKRYTHIAMPRRSRKVPLIRFVLTVHPILGRSAASPRLTTQPEVSQEAHSPLFFCPGVTVRDLWQRGGRRPPPNLPPSNAMRYGLLAGRALTRNGFGSAGAQSKGRLRSLGTRSSLDRPASTVLPHQTQPDSPAIPAEGA